MKKEKKSLTQIIKYWFTFSACGVKPHYRRNRFSESGLDQTVRGTDNKAAKALSEI